MDFHSSYIPLMKIFKFMPPPQTEAELDIKSLPRYITSWLFFLAASLTRLWEYSKPLPPSSIETGKYSALSSHKKASKTNSWTEYNNELRQHSWHQCKETSLKQQRNPRSSVAQLRPSYQMYMRPYKQLFGATRN